MLERVRQAVSKIGHVQTLISKHIASQVRTSHVTTDGRYMQSPLLDTVPLTDGGKHYSPLSMLRGFEEMDPSAYLYGLTRNDGSTLRCGRTPRSYLRSRSTLARRTSIGSSKLLHMYT